MSKRKIEYIKAPGAETPQDAGDKVDALNKKILEVLREENLSIGMSSLMDLFRLGIANLKQSPQTWHLNRRAVLDMLNKIIEEDLCDIGIGDSVSDGVYRH